MIFLKKSTKLRYGEGPLNSTNKLKDANERGQAAGTDQTSSLSLSFSTQMVNMSSRSTQTSSHNVSVGLQTDLPGSRGMALHGKAWSPRPSSTTTSPLASARTRQISTSLDKVHGRIERPCCSPKYGSPKLQRRVSSGKFKQQRQTSNWIRETK